MAPRRKTPETSKIARVSTVAYARKQKSGGGTDDPDGGSSDDTNPELAIKSVPDTIETAPVAKRDTRRADTEPSAGPDERDAATRRDEVKTEPGGVPLLLRPPAAPAEKRATSRPSAPPDKPASEPAKPGPGAPTDKPAASEPAKVEAAARPDPAAPHTEVWPDSTPRPTRIRQDTAAMPVTVPVGSPPEVPAERAVAPPTAPTAAATTGPVSGAAEAPTQMPGPREIPPGAPEDPARPPGRVPPGDSRSLRREGEFALIYRIQTFVITRFGVVGRRGQWRVVEYPTSASAGHAYAKECSRFVSEGFSDYRD